MTSNAWCDLLDPRVAHHEVDQQRVRPTGRDDHEARARAHQHPKPRATQTGRDGEEHPAQRESSSASHDEMVVCGRTGHEGRGQRARPTGRDDQEVTVRAQTGHECWKATLNGTDEETCAEARVSARAETLGTGHDPRARPNGMSDGPTSMCRVHQKSLQRLHSVCHVCWLIVILIDKVSERNGRQARGLTDQ
jgi:hypothetical protein